MCTRIIYVNLCNILLIKINPTFFRTLPKNIPIYCPNNVGEQNAISECA